jgi:undecaprenyl-diphosphatase
VIVSASNRTRLGVVEYEEISPHGGIITCPCLRGSNLELSEPAAGVRILKLQHLWRRLAAVPFEFDVIATIFLVAAASFAFLKITSEVREGETHAIDQAILIALRDPTDLANPIGPEWVEVMFRDLTSLGSPAVLALVTIAAVSYLWIDDERRAAVFVMAAIAGGATLEFLLKLGFARPRPELVSHLVNVNSFSFPSGHATMATITYLTLGVLLARVQRRRRIKLYVLAVATFLALLVGFTRVYLGVHWPTDVIAGWCIGAAWALGCWLVATWLQRHSALAGEQRSGQ